MRRRVYLHGSLREIHPGPIEVEAATPAEAIKRVTLQLFRTRQRVSVAGLDTVESLFSLGPEEIHLLPAFHGGKSGSFFEIIIGAALIATSFFMPENLAWLAPLVRAAGVLLLIGGVLQLLQTPPQTNRSHYLGTPQNTTAIGTPIPVLYGHRLIGGQILSINIQAVGI